MSAITVGQLRKAMEGMPDNAPVRIVTQPNYPMVYDVTHVATQAAMIERMSWDILDENDTISRRDEAEKELLMRFPSVIPDKAVLYLGEASSNDYANSFQVTIWSDEFTGGGYE